MFLMYFLKFDLLFIDIYIHELPKDVCNRALV